VLGYDDAVASRKGTSKPWFVAAAALLLVLGVVVLAAVSYAPHTLGVDDETAFVVVLGLRGLGFLLLLSGAALLVHTREKDRT
jgi:hypothetical protein